MRRLDSHLWVKAATGIYAGSGLLLLGLAAMTQDGRIAAFGVAYLLLAAWYPRRFRRPSAIPMKRDEHERVSSSHPAMEHAVRADGRGTTKGRRARLIALAFVVVGLLFAIAASLGSGWMFGEFTITAWIVAIGLALWAPEDAPKEPR